MPSPSGSPWSTATSAKRRPPLGSSRLPSTDSGPIDALVNNAGIFFTKAFTDYTAEDFRSLVSTNLEGFLYITQLAIKRMLSQKSGGSIVTITASLVDNPIAGITPRSP